MDTYKGPRHAQLRIVDSHRSEALQFDSVVAVNAGRYRVQLDGQVRKDFVAVNRESYVHFCIWRILVSILLDEVVLRVGYEGEERFDEDLVVFPETPKSALESSACVSSLLAVAGLFLLR